MDHLSTRESLRARALDTILLGGLAIGICDFVDASTFFPLYYGITFQQVWWGPASGIVGREAARAGGWNTALLGILMHFTVAFCIATAYLLLTRVIPLLLRRPIISGLVFGVLAHYVMQMVVVPLSARGGTPLNVFNEPFGSMINSLIGHALLVGLPVALIAAWSAKRGKTA
ncbi:MAG TPA: hypothetical protein VGO43_10805 [Pyrinomonadaceae bacterium]|nr:hypothetical protein [Pyrinomonadaceae bacterium]